MCNILKNFLLYNKNPQIMIINTIYYIYNNILYIYTFIHSSAPGMNEQLLVNTRTYSFIPPPRGTV